MFPLKQRKLIRGCKAHINAGLGCGADYIASTGTPLFAPFGGKLTRWNGPQGGNWIRITRDNGERIEFAHLHVYGAFVLRVQEGDKIALTGNTGSITTGPHLHIQAFDKSGKRLDPEKYLWSTGGSFISMPCETEKQEIRKLNTELGVTTPQRDKAIKALEKETKAHEETVEKLEAEFEKRTTAETKLRECLKNKFDGLKFLEKARILLRR